MLKCLSFNYFKRILVIFSLCTFLMFSYNVQRVNAFPAALAAPVAVGGITVTTGEIVALTGCALVAGGVYLDANANDGTCSKYIAQKLIESGNTAQYVGTKTLEGGQKVLTWTKDGLDWLSSTISSIKASPTISVFDDTVPIINGNTFTLPFSTDKFPSGVYYKFTNIGSITNSSSVSQIVTFTSSVRTFSVSLSANTTYYLVSSQYYTGNFVALQIWRSITNFKDGSLLLTGSGDVPSYTTFTSSIPVTGQTVSVPTGSMAQNYGDSVCVDNFMDDIKNTDGSISYQPNIGIPLTSTDGTTYTGNFTDIPYGQTWDDIKSRLIPIPNTGDISLDTPVTGDATGTIDTGTGILSIPILGDILKVLLNILQFLKTLISTLVGTFISALEQLLTKLFVPDKAILTDEFTKVQTNLQDKFPYNMDSLNTLANTSSSELNFVYSFTVMGVPVTLDLNFIKRVVPYSQMLANGLVAIFLVWYNFRKIIWIIRGSAPIGGDGHVGQSSGGSSPVAPPVNPSATSDFRSGDYL